MDDELERIARAEDVLADEAALVGLAHGLLEDLGLEHVFPAYVYEREARPDRVRAEDAALDEAMWAVLDQRAVLEGAGLGLVGVAAEEVRLGALRDELALLAHRKAGAAAPAQARSVDRGQDGLGLQPRAFEDLAHSGVAVAVLDVAVDRAEVLVAEAVGEDARLAHARVPQGSL